MTPFATSSVTGGAEKWLLEMITSTPEVSWKVLALQDGPYCDELRALGIDVLVMKTGAPAVEILRTAAAASRLIARLRPDVVVGNGVKAQLIVTLADPLRRRPTVWVKHDYSFDRTLAGPLGLTSDTVVATAAAVGAAAGRDDLRVIHPPLQSEPVQDRATARRTLLEHGIELNSCRTLVMAGRLVPYKGVDDAIAALAAPAASGWRLIVIGDEDHSSLGERDRLEALAVELGVADRVTFAPPVPGLGSLFAAFDALAVLTKPTDSRAPAKEGFGMTAFEAMQAGIPVIAVDDGPVAERLAGTAGIAVPPGDSGAVAVALDRLGDSAVRTGMGRNGRAIVAAYSDATEAARQFMEALADTARSDRWSGLRLRLGRAIVRTARRDRLTR
ncbi:glycosyltransferase [Brevibacterium casei]|uniref:glycosyltransferase n=1 Tax=Brevibacterium casei TaxID=33889 RepID=UPI00223B5844|nr:glycosyltransferase [Brevibacterium casei]MCT1550182.1 glycosyltransferase [Brevibacterium casei]MCT1560110.1 glycosyltransferase [Brevibacterium casei]MCT2208264.1 glycosyltransferase [Brevibacterium casei]